MHWPDKPAVGLTLREFARLMGLAASMAVAITGVQDLIWPLISSNHRGEKVCWPELGWALRLGGEGS